MRPTLRPVRGRASRIAALTACIILAAPPAPSTAGLFDFIGDVVKAPFEFVGGIVGAPFGGFVNSLATPTIQSAEASGHSLISDLDGRISKRIDEINTVSKERIGQLDESLENRIAQFDKTAEDRIKQADGVMEKRIGQLNSVLSDSIQKVDGVLAERIAQVDDLTERRIGNLDIVVTRAGISFEEATGHVITAACLMVFLCLLSWRIYRTVNKSPKVTWPAAGWLLAETGAGAAALLLIWGLGNYFTGATRRRADRLIDQYRQSYASSLQVLDFRRARYLGSQLQALNPLSLEDRGSLLKAELLREVFTRPTLLQSNGGISDLARSVREVATVLRGDGDLDDPDVAVVAAYIIWQNGRTRTDEYRSACLCMKALEQGEFPLRPLAVNYVQMYAHDPLPTKPGLAGDIADGLPDYDHEQITAKAKALDEEEFSTATQAVELRKKREKNFSPLMHVIAYDRLVRKLDREASDAYVEMVEAQVEYRIAFENLSPAEQTMLPTLALGVDKFGHPVVLGGELKPESRGDIADAVLTQHDVLAKQNATLTPGLQFLIGPATRRLAAAVRVRDAWEEFDRGLKEGSVFLGTSTRLAAFSLNDAIFSRAMWFVAQPNTPDSAPSLFALNPASNPAAATDGQAKIPKDGDLRKMMLPKRIGWRNAFASDLGGVALDLIDSEEYHRFRLYEDRSLAFEAALLDYFRIKANDKAPGRNTQTFLNCLTAAKAAADLGIYTTRGAKAEAFRQPYSHELLAQLTNDEVTKGVLDNSANQRTRQAMEAAIATLIERRSYKSL
jgi:hypothetical protein